MGGGGGGGGGHCCGKGWRLEGEEKGGEGRGGERRGKGGVEKGRLRRKIAELRRELKCFNMRFCNVSGGK